MSGPPDFRAFVDARWPELVRFAYALTADRGDAEDVAWWLTRPAPYGRWQPTTELGMVGPRNAVTARITVAGAEPITVPLQHVAGVGDVPDAEHVTFLGSGGQALASTTVGEPWSWENGALSHQI